MGGINFGWLAFWVLSPDWLCSKLDVRDVCQARGWSRRAWGRECGPKHTFASYTLALALQMRKNHGKKLSSSPGRNIDQVRNKAAQRLGTLGPLLNRRSGLSIKNGVLLYKQLTRPMMDYVCPVWRSAARSHIKKLQVLQSKCFRIATNAPWYIGDRQIHDDLGVPYFSDHIRSLTERFDSKLADVGNPLVEDRGRYLLWPSVDLRPLTKGYRGR